METVELELLRQSWNLIVPRTRTRQVVARYGEERGEVGRKPPAWAAHFEETPYPNWCCRRF